MKVKCWNMARMKMSVLGIGILSIILNAHLFSVSSAPVSNNQLFYSRMYQNSSMPGCFLPKVNESLVNFTSSKINHLCDSETEDSHHNLCNALIDLFARICQISSISSKVNVTSPVDLMKVNSLGVQKVCSNLEQLQSNISKIAGQQNFESPFVTAAGSNKQGNEGSLCISLCKNSRDTREGFPEDSDLEVSPACILLLEGYIIFQKISVGNLISSKVVRPSPVVTLPDNEISISNGAVKIADPVVISKGDTKTMGSARDKVVSIENFPPENASPTTSAKGEMDHVADTTKSTVVPSAEKVKPVEQSPITLEKVDTNSMKNPDILNQVPSDDKTEPVPISKKSENPKLEDDSKLSKKQKDTKDKITVSSSKTSSTTEAAIDARENEEPMPMDKEIKIKSSTTTAPKLIKFADENEKDKVAPMTNAIDSSTSEKSKPVKTKTKISKPDVIKKNEDSDALAGLENDDGAEYNPGDDMDNGLVKPPAGEDEKDELDIPQPETQNLGYDADSSFKPPKSFSGSAFSNDLGFGHGTTINVSLKESEDTGFFNYFLFCVTLVGLVYLIIHNKKKLIAYVVEGKRPRSRSRRNSGSSQYRRLENNFD